MLTAWFGFFIQKPLGRLNWLTPSVIGSLGSPKSTAIRYPMAIKIKSKNPIWQKILLCIRMIIRVLWHFVLGLLLINIHENRFKRLLFQADVTKKARSYRGILEKNHQLLISTEGGIFIGDKTKGTFQEYPEAYPNVLNPLGTFWYALSSGKTAAIFAGSEFGLSRLTPEMALIRPCTSASCVCNALRNCCKLPNSTSPKLPTKLVFPTLAIFQGLFVRNLERHQVHYVNNW